MIKKENVSEIFDLHHPLVALKSCGLIPVQQDFVYSAYLWSEFTVLMGLKSLNWCWVDVTIGQLMYLIANYHIST